MLERHLLDGPRNSIYGIYDDLAQVRDLTDRLLALGLQDAKVRILQGDAGARELDRDGRHHGLIARLRRSLQGLTDERGHVEEYEWAVRRGRIVVSVQLPPRTDRSPVCAAFRETGATFVHHYGAWVVQQLSA